MHFKVKHVTRYNYADRVTRCYNLANVIPRNTARQRCLKTHVMLSPLPATSHTRTDYFGNRAFQFEIQKPHTELVITAESEVDLHEMQHDAKQDNGISYQDALTHFSSSHHKESIEAREFVLDSPMISSSESLESYAKVSFEKNRPLKACVKELTSRIYDEFSYDPQFSTVATPLAEVIEHKKGVCQDFAHLQVGCLRAMGVPAKYVSGYIETLPKPGEEKLVGADATHAWVAFYCPEEGWIEFDPTNDTIAGNQHIVTAFGRDYDDVTPVRGVIFGGGEAPLLSVSVDVSRVQQN